LKFIEVLRDYLAENPKIKKTLRGEPLQSVSPSTLPAAYNDVPFEGDRYVGSTCCKTVGQYKAACDKFYDPV
jgi:hypothetical protein